VKWHTRRPPLRGKTTSEKSLYDRLGGYDVISAVTLSMLDRMEKDPQLGRFWAHRSIDGVKRERQFIVDFMSPLPADRSTMRAETWCSPIGECV